VAETAPLRVQLIAKTEFTAPDDVAWGTDADGGPALVEFAGRACYQSWDKPNPRTATNAAYIKHIIDVGHFSVLEHASVSFYVTGISRSCTHELIRHRHFSYSQLSQRYVPEHDAQVVLPPGIEGDPELEELVLAAADASRAAYTELLTRLDAKLADEPGTVRRNSNVFASRTRRRQFHRWSSTCDCQRDLLCTRLRTPFFDQHAQRGLLLAGVHQLFHRSERGGRHAFRETRKHSAQKARAVFRVYHPRQSRKCRVGGFQDGIISLTVDFLTPRELRRLC